MENDPDELHNLAEEASLRRIRIELEKELIEHAYGSDLQWITDGELVGLDEKEYVFQPDRGLRGQRGWRFMG